MKESGTPLNTDGRSPLLLLVSGKTSQKEAAAFNSKAMNTICNAVSIEEFKRMSNVEVAYTACNILQTVHEGIKAIKINKLQQLTSKFESIRMSDDESFDNYMLSLMILLILHIIWVKSMINLKLLGRFLDL